MPSTKRTPTPGSSDSSIVTTPSAPTRDKRLGDDAADQLVLLGGDRRHLHEVRALDRPRDPHELGGHGRGRLLDAPPQQHRVRALVQCAHALAHDRLSEQRRGGGAVARLVRGLVGDLADELRAHVLVLVGELDLPRDRHPVVGDRGSAGEALQHDVAPLRAEGHLDRVGQLVHACLQQETSLMIEVEALAHVFSSERRYAGTRMPRPCRRPWSRSAIASLMASSGYCEVCRVTLPCAVKVMRSCRSM